MPIFPTGAVPTTTATSIGSSSSVAGDSSLFDALSDASTIASTPHNPSAWLPEHQQQFMQALLNASAGTASGGNASFPGLSSPIGDPTNLVDPSAPLIDNPFAALVNLPEDSNGNGGIGAFPPGLKFLPQLPPTQESKSKTLLQKLLPLLHLVAIWCLLAYFVLLVEPKAYGQAHASILAAEEDGFLQRDTAFWWRRWTELSQRRTLSQGPSSYRVQVVVYGFFLFQRSNIDILCPSLSFGHLPHSKSFCTQYASSLVLYVDQLFSFHPY